MYKQLRASLLGVCLCTFYLLVNVQAQQLDWTRQLGTASGDQSLGVAADAFGNVYISGVTAGDLDGASSGGSDAFVSKYDASGSLQWTRQFGTVGPDQSHGNCVDTVGNVYVAGITSGSLGGPNAGDYDAFLSKFDASGNMQWSRQLGSSAHEYAADVFADVLGNVYITGRTKGNLGGANAGGDDAWVSKYDAAGSLQWVRQLGTSGNDFSRCVSADSLGNVYIAGTTNRGLGGPNAGFDDAFASKIDALGNILWTRQFGTSSNDTALGISADVLGSVYITGSTQGNLGGLSAGSFDAYLRKLDTSGNLQWTRQFGTTHSDSSADLSTDVLGNIFVAGITYGNINGPNVGGSDAFVSKFDPVGNLQWARQLGTSGDEDSVEVSADSVGNVYISGFTEGSLGGPNLGTHDAFLAKYSTIPEPGTLLLGCFASAFILLKRRRYAAMRANR